MATFTGKFGRMWRHWMGDSARTREAFPQATLDAIAMAIDAGEKTHRSELRLVVEAALPAEAAWDGVTMRQRALSLFAELGIWDTEDNCGVLIYVNLTERKVEIVGDRKVNRVILPNQWQHVCNTMTSGFAKGEYQAATLAAIEEVNTLLREHFPSEGERVNELPDHPVVL
jgi:uncharacterized membrane protein